MAGCYVEHRFVPKNTAISWDIAHHLYTRQLQGVAIIIVPKPESLLSALTKQWYKIIRHIERERSSTLNASRIMELSYEISAMQRMRFAVSTSEKPTPASEADVLLTTMEYAATLLATCHTIYLADDTDSETFAKLEHVMPPQSLMVAYERAES
ncbi:MAG TPA: hypothetical protein VLG11_02045 [Candidatus Saccharimonadales bacterium]|nr:hypothetical protein [Candidatus Saccharimonadales bacterium]